MTQDCRKYIILRAIIPEIYMPVANWSKYTSFAFLHEEILRRMMERLSLMAIDPKFILDMGAGIGLSSSALQARFPQASIVAIDLLAELLATNKNYLIQADMRKLPFAKRSFDMVFSHCAFYWVNNLKEIFAEVKRIASHKALFFFATYGPDTFFELRQACQQIKNLPEIPAFTDMHDIGDMLLELGFVDPVMEAEKITVDYQSVAQIIKDLQGVGDIQLIDNYEQFDNSECLTQLQNYYEDLRTPEGKLPLTYEIVFGHAWLPEATALSQPNENGEVYISLDQIKSHAKPQK